MGGGASQEEPDARADEERRIKALMKGMAQAEGDEMFVSTAAVGSIVGLQSAEILQMASEYEEKRADLAAGKKPDKASGAQAHKRMVAALEKQIAMQEKKCGEVSLSLNLSTSLFFNSPSLLPSHPSPFSLPLPPSFSLIINTSPPSYKVAMMSCMLTMLMHKESLKR